MEKNRAGITVIATIVSLWLINHLVVLTTVLPFEPYLMAGLIGAGVFMATAPRKSR